MEKYNLVGVGYDPQFMDLVEIELSEIGVETTRRFGAKGLFMNPHPQGFRAGPLIKNKDPYRVPLYMPRSIDALEAVILREQIKVRYNPAVRSAALGTVVIKDASENRRLTKGKSTTRIDAMVALTISQGFAVAQRIEPIQRGVQRLYISMAESSKSKSLFARTLARFGFDSEKRNITNEAEREWPMGSSGGNHVGANPGLLSLAAAIRGLSTFTVSGWAQLVTPRLRMQR